MPFTYALKSTLGWQYRILKTLLRAHARITLSVILLQALSKIAYLLAFLLPLKVILLIGTPGVPRYFPFVDPAQKMDWVVGLTLGAISCYLLALIFDHLTSRLAKPGASAMVKRANKMTVIRNQDTLAQSYYERITGIAANNLFIALGLVLLYFINLPVFSFILLFSLFGLTLTALMLWTAQTQNTSPATNQANQYIPSYFIPQNTIQAWLTKNPKTYTSVLSSTAFLMGFLLILYPYLDGDGPNILISLISFLVLRQIASFAEANINASFTLNKNAQKINALVFKSQKTSIKERKHKTLLRDIFEKKRRTALVNDQLKPGETTPATVNWMDSNLTGVTLLKIETPTTPTQFAQQQIFNKQSRHLLEREAFLFTYIDRAQFKAPPVLAQYQIQDFDCQILDYGTAEPLLAKDFRAALNSLNQQIFHRFIPPKALVKDYKLTRPLLADKFSSELVKRLEVGIDTPEERQQYKQLQANLPSLIQRLDAQPLYIYNPDRKPGTLVWQTDQRTDLTQVYIMAWGRWSLEPLGIAFDLNQPDEWFDDKASWLKANRKDIRAHYSGQDLKLVACAQKLQQALNASHFKRALHYAQTLNALIETHTANKKQNGNAV
ncbi:hypothetical protein [Thiomicrospira cyclica]|uniref:Uncharacterized protein n=1 Tax=Thiomicrospira cyclica (strain DSM 14477 / JCM 11371 / ALM1) TaxID=717773 RepID=F6DCV7_THICA|nr:hypothetical protein [Thiomicrospira cyclica]AEG31693.1 hypothetical protein Thicy_0926 [Thiomicrospira cyclica ALM1]